MKTRLGNVLLLALMLFSQPLFAQRFPAVSESQRIAMLKPPVERPVRMVLDTDTYNEIDDQFAVVYALISPELNVQAVYAAPFTNNRSTGPGDGMQKSYEEILRVLERLGRSPEGFAYKGSTHYLTDPNRPEASPAARDLVERAKKSSPDLMEKIVVKQWDEVEQDYIDIVDNDDLDAFAKFMLLSKAARERKVKTVYLWDVLENEKDSLLVKRMTEEGFKRMIPLMVRIVEQGVREGVFDTPYPQEAVEFLMHGTESVTAANIADPAVFRRRMLASFDIMRRILGADQAMIDHIVEEAEAVFQAVADQMDKKKDSDEKRSNGVDE